MSDFEAEKTFWEGAVRADQYNLETVGRAYLQYETLVKVERKTDGSFPCFGDWVRAEDYRKDVEALEQQVAVYKALADAPVAMMEEDQAVLDAFSRLSLGELAEISALGSAQEYLVSAEYARREIERGPTNTP